MKAKCTLKDVALACGVSAYTVSRAMNDKKDISKETKERILEVAKEMGYVQNVNAKNLRVGSSRNIAIIYDDFENPYYNYLIKKITYILSENGYSVTLFYDLDSISILNTKLMNRVLSSNVDAIISFIYVTPSAKKLNSIWKKPIIQIGAPSTENDISCFLLDNYSGGKMITNYLLEKGCRKIGFINATEQLVACLNRIEGYKAAHVEKGFAFNEDLIVHLHETDLDITDATQLLIDKNCDSIICYNDISALASLKYLHENNLLNIEVCGFDNIKQSIPIPTPFPSVHGDTDVLVEESVNFLLERIKNPSDIIVNKVFDVKIYH